MKLMIGKNIKHIRLQEKSNLFLLFCIINNDCYVNSFIKTVTTQQLMKYVCNFKLYSATCLGSQEAIIRQLQT
jgi:hypothetical protein